MIVRTTNRVAIARAQNGLQKYWKGADSYNSSYARQPTVPQDVFSLVEAGIRVVQEFVDHT